jgi:hypothetical protein
MLRASRIVRVKRTRFLSAAPTLLREAYRGACFKGAGLPWCLLSACGPEEPIPKASGGSDYRGRPDWRGRDRRPRPPALQDAILRQSPRMNFVIGPQPRPLEGIIGSKAPTRGQTFYFQNSFGVSHGQGQEQTSPCTRSRGCREAKIDRGIARPGALAVSRFTIISNLVGS